MKKDIAIKPEWINEQKACEWLGVNRTTLFKMKQTLGLQFTYLGKNRILMYDKNQINDILFNNSTYAVLNK